MPKSRSKKESTSLSLNELNRVKQTSKTAHGTAANTKVRYQGYLRRGQEWLDTLLEQTKHEELGEQPWTLTDLVQAFGPVPTRASPWAVAGYMTFKCFEQSNGIATAEGIHAAFKKFWENSNNEGRYHGDWKWDEERKVCLGNPASSPDVIDTLRAIKRKYGAGTGTVRNHSVAMSFEYLDRIFCWSQKQCSITFPFPPAETLTLVQRHNIYKHLGWRTFSSLSWTIWTRNSETLNLQFRHLTFDPLLRDQSKKFFWYITLEHWKNWENKLESSGSASQGMRFRIFPQSDLPAADIDYHMRIWLSFLRSHVYGRPLQPNDWLFPSINSNGIIHPENHMSHDVIQAWIDEFSRSAGISNIRFTTHCFRRGGAQYRFTRAPAAKRWSLETVRWWGGWAEGEQTDTLMRYLMDDLHSQEHTFEDALAPEKEMDDISFMGARKDMNPPTYEDIKSMMTSFERTVYLSELGLSCRDMQNLNMDQDRPRQSICCHCCSCLPSSNPVKKRGIVLPADSPLPPGSSNSPPAGLCIPKLTGAFEQRWKLIVKQWEESDPSKGLLLPLKDWKPEWKTSTAFAMTYHNRSLVALEFIEKWVPQL